eukprot:s8985_g1.t1
MSERLRKRLLEMGDHAIEEQERAQCAVEGRTGRERDIECVDGAQWGARWKAGTRGMHGERRQEAEAQYRVRGLQWTVRARDMALPPLVHALHRAPSISRFRLLRPPPHTVRAPYARTVRALPSKQGPISRTSRKTQEEKDVLNKYQKLSRYDSQKKELVELWAGDKSCKWYSTWEKKITTAEAEKANERRGFGTR